MAVTPTAPVAPITSFKMPFRTTHFNANHRVWVVSMSGAMAALCCGKFRGKGRYVRAWVKWGVGARPTPAFQTFDVDTRFWESVMGIEYEAREEAPTMAVDPIVEFMYLYARFAGGAPGRAPGCRFLTNDRRRFGALVGLVGDRLVGKHDDELTEGRRCGHVGGVIVADDPLEGMMPGALVLEFDDGRTYPLRGWNEHVARNSPPCHLGDILDPCGLFDGRDVTWTGAMGELRRGTVRAEPDGWIVQCPLGLHGVLEYARGRWIVGMSYDARGLAKVDFT